MWDHSTVPAGPVAVWNLSQQSGSGGFKCPAAHIALNGCLLSNARKSSYSPGHTQCGTAPWRSVPPVAAAAQPSAPEDARQVMQ